VIIVWAGEGGAHVFCDVMWIIFSTREFTRLNPVLIPPWREVKVFKMIFFVYTLWTSKIFPKENVLKFQNLTKKKKLFDQKVFFRKNFFLIRMYQMIFFPITTLVDRFFSFCFNFSKMLKLKLANFILSVSLDTLEKTVWRKWLVSEKLLGNRQTEGNWKTSILKFSKSKSKVQKKLWYEC